MKDTTLLEDVKGWLIALKESWLYVLMAAIAIAFMIIAMQMYDGVGLIN